MPRVTASQARRVRSREGVLEFPRVIQFSRPAPVSLFPPPETGEGQGGGEGRWRAQTVLLPPIPTFPRQGGRSRRPRKAKEKSRTEWPCPFPLWSILLRVSSLITGEDLQTNQVRDEDLFFVTETLRVSVYTCKLPSITPRCNLETAMLPVGPVHRRTSRMVCRLTGG